MIRKISEVMTRNVMTAKKDDLVREAVSIMTKNGISCVIIANEKYHPEGIVTERDMVRRVLNNRLDPGATKLSEIMSSPVMTMSPEKRITEAINLMTKYHFRRSVIADDKGKLLGILTQSDLLSEISKVQKELEETNKSLMTTVKSLQRYSKIGTENERIKLLKKKITRLEKEADMSRKPAKKGID